ncbi:YbaB/EbfC family nucleoid-associated protein [Nonomuraea indica]|uniref:YbaB/EbfC family nucleoid-associated protein n=1 Tax=Nonomuraea indica TaxID=1581193 RepID=UPI0015DF3784|nr:YbaB/EbfC family nucleoid-associated protein [Nonomuraea indica]
MSYFPSGDLDPANLERLVRESEESVRRLADATAELEAISGTGRSRSELVSAEVDNGGGIRRVAIDPRAMRLGSEELSEQVCEAVRAAQEDVQRQGLELLTLAVGADATRAAVDLDALQRQLQDVQSTFARSVDASAAVVDRISRRPEW